MLSIILWVLIGCFFGITLGLLILTMLLTELGILRKRWTVAIFFSIIFPWLCLLSLTVMNASLLMNS